MQPKIMYIELKTGFSNDGPAWIGRVNFSKSGQTLYFDNKAIKKLGTPINGGNYYDIETGEAYWVSGIKKNGQDRHWAGSGKIMIEKSSVKEYLTLVDFDIIEKKYYDLIDFKPTDKERFRKIENLELRNN